MSFVSRGFKGRRRPPADQAERLPPGQLCGPPGFLEAAADALVELGHPPEAIRAERFGPTGS